MMNDNFGSRTMIISHIKKKKNHRTISFDSTSKFEVKFRSSETEHHIIIIKLFKRNQFSKGTIINRSKRKDK